MRESAVMRSLLLICVAGCSSTTVDAIPFSVGTYDDGSKLLRVHATVGGAPVDLLVDTGSSGMRVFASSIAGAAIAPTNEAISIEFGGGDTIVGHTASATVAFGSVSAPIAFHLVESFTCNPAIPDCDFADGTSAFFASAGIGGILGIGLRSGEPASVYSPFAQLADGFEIQTSGSIVLTAPASLDAIQLASDGTLPNGKPAWRDDQLHACFAIAGEPIDPPCTDAAIDSGSSTHVIYAPHLRAITAVTATIGALDLDLAAPVLVDDQDPFALLGVGLFLDHDIGFDVAAGRIHVLTK